MGSLIFFSPIFFPFCQGIQPLSADEKFSSLFYSLNKGKKEKKHKYPVLPTLHFAKTHFTLHVVFGQPQFDHMTDIPMMIWKYWECSLIKPPRTMCFYVEDCGRSEEIHVLLAS